MKSGSCCTTPQILAIVIILGISVRFVLDSVKTVKAMSDASISDKAGAVWDEMLSRTDLETFGCGTAVGAIATCVMVCMTLGVKFTSPLMITSFVIGLITALVVLVPETIDLVKEKMRKDGAGEE